MDSINQATENAVDTMKDIINDPLAKHSDRIAASKDILDRAGYGAVKKVQGQVDVHVTDDTMKAVNMRIAQARAGEVMMTEEQEELIIRKEDTDNTEQNNNI